MILFQLSASENIPFSFLDWEEVVLKLRLSANLGGETKEEGKYDCWSFPFYQIQLKLKGFLIHFTPD